MKEFNIKAKEFYQSLSYNRFQLPKNFIDHTNTARVALSDLSDLYDHITNEIKKYTPLSGKMSLVREWINHLTDAKNSLDNLEGNLSKAYFTSYISDKLSFVPIFDHPTISYWISSCEKQGFNQYYIIGYYDGITSQVENRGISFYNQKMYHIGLLDGHNSIKKDTISDGITSLVVGVEELISQISKRYSDIKLEQEKKVNENNLLLDNMIKKVDENEKSRLIQSDSMINQRTEKFNALESLYTEKLRLSKPADYWNKTGKKYNKNGSIWFMATSIVALLSVSGLLIVIIKYHEIFETGDLFLSIRNTAVLTIITSIIIYIIRVMVKIALSSLHLSRDAYEREQLTYFYLSLIEGKAASSEERKLILSSLFSRADTGLLKGDSSPEMPTISPIVDVVGKKN